MTLIATLFRRRFIEVVRYPFELVTGLIIFYSLFLMLFLGAQLFGGEDVRTGDTLSAVVVGYVVFVVVMQSYMTFGQQLIMESQAGTLEQLAMSPSGLRRSLLIDFFAQAATMVATLGIVIVPIMMTTGRWLHFDVSILPILALSLTGIVGVGLSVGGLVIVFKRAQAAAQSVAFLFLFLLGAPVFEEPVLKLLPLAHGNAMLRRIMVDGESLADIGWDEQAILVAVSAAWLLLGLWVFGAMERAARDRALLGQY